MIFLFLRARLQDEKRALWLALLYAFATPVFFRSAFLNQNAIVAHCILFGYIAAAGFNPRGADEPIPPRRAAIVGLLLGFGLLTDYSAVPLFLVFAAWVAWEALRGPQPRRSALRGITGFALGALPPILLLMAYQWRAFGNPFMPAQVYMPATEYSVKGWHGFFWPDPKLLFGNLFDLQYGLLAFCPMLLVAVAAPFLKRREGGPSVRELWLIFAATIGLYLFISSVQFAYLQFNTGVRYMVPVVPLLFVALVPVLLWLPRLVFWLVLLPTIAVSWSVAMVREDVPLSLLRVFLRGFELPWLTVLEKTASGYAPFLSEKVSPIPVFCFTGVIIWLIWKEPRRKPVGLLREE